MKALILIALILSTGCTKSKPADANTYLYTVNHDDHKFIFHSMFARPGGLIHHPGCDCLTNEVDK